MANWATWPNQTFAASAVRPSKPLARAREELRQAMFQRAINRRHVQAAEMAAREMGGLSLSDALALCQLLATTDPQRYERAALR